MRNLLLNFFEKVGKSQEIDLFVQRFKAVPRHQFAVIRVAYGVIEDYLDDLAESLSFMQHMGIYPIIVLDIKTDSYSDASLSPVSDSVAGKRFLPAATQLIEALGYHDGFAEIVENIVDVTSIRPSNWTLDDEAIMGVLEMGRIPIVSAFGRRNRRRVFVNADELSRLLVYKLNPIKYILLTETVGIIDQEDNVLPFLNLSHRKEWSHVKSDMKPIVKEVRLVLKKTPDCAAIFTSPQNLLKEIFTIKGSGTFVKKYSLASTSKISDLDTKRVTSLLEEAFGKRLVDDFFEEKIKMVLFEKNYEGVAIIKKIRGIPYLDKIAVAKTSEGTGLGRSLWQKVAEMYPKLVWRSTPINPLSSFYLRECDGCMKFPKWIVYWRNLDESEIFPIVRKILEIRTTLHHHEE